MSSLASAGSKDTSLCEHESNRFNINGLHGIMAPTKNLGAGNLRYLYEFFTKFNVFI
jgi:hypothetical protein